MRGKALGLAFLLAALCAPASARAQGSVERGWELFFEADFAQARDVFEEVLESPTLSTATALEAHRFLTALYQLLGEEPMAEAHARAAVALDPSVQPPDGMPEEVGALFARARAQHDGATARLVIEGDELLVAPATVRARLIPAADMLLRRIELRCGDEERQGRPPQVEIALEQDGESVSCEARGVTAGGAIMMEASRLFYWGVTDGERSGGDGGGSAWPWVGAAIGVALAAALVVLIVKVSGTDRAHFEAPQVEGW